MSELKRPSKRALAWAELAGEVGVILLGALIFFALGWTFGVWLMLFGAIGIRDHGSYGPGGGRSGDDRRMGRGTDVSACCEPAR